MSWYLCHGGVLTRKSTVEVEELLGKPDTTDLITGTEPPKFQTSGTQPGTEVWYYDLGGEKYAPGIGPSGAVLAIDFKDGEVVRVRKVIH